LPDLVWAGAVDAAPAHTVEVLYFDGCPNYEALVPHLRELLRNAGGGARIYLRSIPDERAARRERFLGSPTVRVDGHDVEPGASQRNNFGMQCRLYATGDGVRATPLDEWVLTALGQPASPQRRPPRSTTT
jgi:hypothetical protein